MKDGRLKRLLRRRMTWVLLPIVLVFALVLLLAALAQNSILPPIFFIAV